MSIVNSQHRHWARLQTASVLVTVGSLGNQNTFIRPYSSSFYNSQGCSLYSCILASSLHLEINCVNIKQRRYRAPWRPESVYILIIWTLDWPIREKAPSASRTLHCVWSLDYSTCLFNLFDGRSLPLWACTFSDNHCCEVKQNISGCQAKPGTVPWITAEMLKNLWPWSRTLGSW